MARKSPWKFWHVCSIAAVVAFALASVSHPQPASKSNADSASARVLTQFGKLPLYFIENQGQVNERVGYYLQGNGKSIYFTSDGVVFALSEERKREPGSPFQPASYQPSEQREGWTVKLEFVGANPEAQPVGVERTAAIVSYFRGRPTDWRAGVATYAGVAYKDLWPGIDLVYAGTNGRLKYTFSVAPGVDPGQVRLAYRGASAVKLNDHGKLEIETPVGGFAEDKPYVYQEIDGQRVEVESAYELEDGEYSFRLGNYDRSRPLVLDPVVLVYAGFIGGSGWDRAFSIAVDGAGNAYIAGETYSYDVIGFDYIGGAIPGNGDAFVAKVNAAGTALVYGGYIGGVFNDGASGIAVDQLGNAYVSGTTSSDNNTFPSNVGPLMGYNGGESDGFVAKVDPSGYYLLYCGYIGGPGGDGAADIAVDALGNAYVVGETNSDNGFPVKVGPQMNYMGGPRDPFVAKVKADGTDFDYIGFVAGSGYDRGFGIAVDRSGSAYVVGHTTSTDFPVIGGLHPYYGNNDAFLAKVRADGTGLVYSGHIGGSGGEYASQVAVDSSGNAYVTGDTDSTDGDFIVFGPDTTFNGGTSDAFVAKVNGVGTLVYAGYIGGSGQDGRGGIAVDDAGNAYVAGVTNSTDFPALGEPGTTFNGGTDDGFVAKVNAEGTALAYARYVGGSGGDTIHDVAVDALGNAYVTGVTGSPDFPVTVGPDLSYNGGVEAFVAKISEGVPVAVRLATRTGAGIAGAEVAFQDRFGAWQPFGTTGPEGLASGMLPAGTWTFRMTHAGRSITKTQDVSTTVEFLTTAVTLQFTDVIEYAEDGGAWRAFSKPTMELLSGDYQFRFGPAGTFPLAVAEAPLQQSIAAVKLIDSAGSPMLDGSVQYYLSGWRPVTPIGAGGFALLAIDGLRTNVSFRMWCASGSQDALQNIATNSMVTFQTRNVVVQLKNSAGNPLDPGTVSYYASGWRSFGTTSGGTVSKELLAGNYSFRMQFAGTSQDLAQNVGANPVVTFQTRDVTVKLTSSTGVLLAGGAVKYYASAWRDFGTTGADGEAHNQLLAGSYSFRMQFAYGTKDQAQNIGTNPLVPFQTGAVVSASGRCTSYYAGAWRTFTNGMQLMPSTYTFRFNDGTADTQYSISAAVTNNIH